MARAFTPSRSALYGAPEHRARIGVADTILGALVHESNEEIDALYRQQVSSGNIAKEKERQALRTYMQEHQAEPEKWRGHFAKSRERIRKGVMSGITQPQARNVVSLELDESMAEWEGWIGNNAAVQAAANTNADYQSGLKGLYESRAYLDDTDMVSHLSAGLTHIESGFNGGSQPVDSVPTRAVAEQAKRDFTRRVVGDYLAQQALAAGDPGILDHANDMAPRSVLDDQIDVPLFGPDDIRALKKGVELELSAARIQADKVNAERVKTNDRNLRAAVLQTLRGAAKPGEEMTPALIEAAMRNGDNSEETGWMMSQALTRAVEDSPTREERSRAFGIVSRTTDRFIAGEMSYDEWDAVYVENFNTLDEADAEYFEKLGGKTHRTRADKAIADAGVLAERVLLPKFTSEDEVVDELGLDSALGDVMKEIRQVAEEFTAPDQQWKPDEFRKEVNRILQPRIEEAVKDVVGKLPLVDRLFPWGSNEPASWESTMGYDFYSQSPNNPPKKPSVKKKDPLGIR